MKTLRTRSRGFTLIEMAMVLLIMGLLLGGGLTLLGAQIESQKIKDTQRVLDEAKEALVGFALANGRLPCPAPANAVTGTALAGLEPSPVVAAGCTNLAGVLPWATLGVNETDAWGNRLSYRVTRQFTRNLPQANFLPGTCTIPPLPPPPFPPANAAFALCSQGDMTVLSTGTGGGATLASTIPVMVISHGKNGSGAYNTAGKQVPISTDADEVENSDGDINFVSKTPTATFDDLVTWLSPNILFNRMVQAGKLP